MEKLKTELQKKNGENETRKPELISLNKELYNEFSIEELEQRLETKLWGCDCNGVYTECPTNGGCTVDVDIP